MNSFAAVLALITAALTVAKVMGLTAWSWWWVLSPLWVPVSVMLLFIGWWVAAAGWDQEDRRE